ncbi:MAG: hypothetical protein WDW38_011327 [Sanguina aurantia]
MPQSVVVVFQFGSAICFQTSPEQEREFVGLIQAHTMQALASTRTDFNTVVIRPNMAQWFAKEEDRIIVQSMDVGNVEVIARIIAQSVALDHYHSKVDHYLQDFGGVLAEVAAPSQSSSPLRLLPFSSKIRSEGLMATLCASSMLYTEVISKLGLLDTPRTAWRRDKYDAVWSALREEYQLDIRLEQLSKKLVPIQDVARFILEVRRDRAAAASEIIIIALIAVEVAIAVVHNYF